MVNSVNVWTKNPKHKSFCFSLFPYIGLDSVECCAMKVNKNKQTNDKFKKKSTISIDLCTLNRSTFQNWTTVNKMREHAWTAASVRQWQPTMVHSNVNVQLVLKVNNVTSFQCCRLQPQRQTAQPHQHTVTKPLNWMTMPIKTLRRRALSIATPSTMKSTTKRSWRWPNERRHVFFVYYIRRSLHAIYLFYLNSSILCCFKIKIYYNEIVPLVCWADWIDFATPIQAHPAPELGW